MPDTILKPIVSIIMNCYNGAEFLEESIDSVINQTYQNWELIFWDNQSTDNSAEILKSYDDRRIKYFYAPNHTKLYAARNFAIEKAEGEYLAFLDTDDIWIAEKLSKQLNLLNNRSSSFACSNYYLIDSKTKIIKKAMRIKKPSGSITKYLIDDYYVGILTVLFERKILNINNFRFNENYNHIGDYELFLKISENQKIIYDSQPLAKYRIHNNNFSSKKQIELLREIKVMIREFANRGFYINKIGWIKKLKQVRVYMLIKILIKRKNPNSIFFIYKFFKSEYIIFIKLIIIYLLNKLNIFR